MQCMDNHLYDKDTNKKDFFNHGGKSEFYGHSYENQLLKIKKGLEIFLKKEILKLKYFLHQIILMMKTLLEP